MTVPNARRGTTPTDAGTGTAAGAATVDGPDAVPDPASLTMLAPGLRILPLAAAFNAYLVAAIPNGLLAKFAGEPPWQMAIPQPSLWCTNVTSFIYDQCRIHNLPRPDGIDLTTLPLGL